MLCHTVENYEKKRALLNNDNTENDKKDKISLQKKYSIFSVWAFL